MTKLQILYKILDLPVTSVALDAVALTFEGNVRVTFEDGKILVATHLDSFKLCPPINQDRFQLFREGRNAFRDLYSENVGRVRAHNIAELLFDEG